ncbi:MAG TPA: zf-HC2 domain-containing protein [Candidatus Aquilonibacter sp.]|nr:zf-HC2 domain-containing protein [Candidatus Aquilonibacter sp.]
MPDHTENLNKGAAGTPLQCHEFDAVLTDALDGILHGPQLDRFQAHARTCAACGPLFAEAEAGRNWLKSLTEVEPPASLVVNILASTTGVDTQRLRESVPASQPHVSWLERVQAWASGTFEPVWATVRQPRFAMSFGMAFFALSVALSVLGVTPADLRQVSLRPSALRHSYYSTQARVIRYYENIRFVYEVESRVREIRRNMVPAEATPVESAPAKPKERKNDTSKEPEQRQENNYSQSDSDIILASTSLGPSVVDPLNQDRLNQDRLNQDLPVVSVTTYRRFV